MATAQEIQMFKGLVNDIGLTPAQAKKVIQERRQTAEPSFTPPKPAKQPGVPFSATSPFGTRLDEPTPEPIGERVVEAGKEAAVEMGTAIKEAGIGALKGAGETIVGTTELGLKGLQAIEDVTVGPLLEKLRPGFQERSQEVTEKLTEELEEVREEKLEPETPMEAFGKATEQILEFVIPSAKIAKVQKAAPFLAKVLSQGTISTAIESAQSGELGLEELKTGGISAGVEAVASGIGPVAQALRLRNLTTPSRMEKVLQQVTKSADDADEVKKVVDIVGKENLVGGKKTIMKKLQDAVTKTRGQKSKALSQVDELTKDSTQVKNVTNKLLNILKGQEDDFGKEIARVKEIHRANFKNGVGNKATDLQDLMDIFDNPEIQSIFLEQTSQVGRQVKTGVGKAASARSRQGLKELLEDLVEKGADTNLKELNKRIQVTKTLQNAMESSTRKEVAKSAVKGATAGGITGVLVIPGDTAEERLRNFVGGAILGKFATNPALTTRVAKVLDGINPRTVKIVDEYIGAIFDTNKELPELDDESKSVLKGLIDIIE